MRINKHVSYSYPRAALNHALLLREVRARKGAGLLILLSMLLVNNAHADYENALFRAIEVGNVSEVKNILSDPKAVRKLDFRRNHLETESNDTFLTLAVRMGNLKIVRRILAASPQSDEQASKNGYTPLRIAAQQGLLDVVKELLAKGAKPDLAMNDGATPMIAAAQNGHLDVVKSLLRAGARPNLAARDGATPLFVAAQNGYLDVVKLLLRKSADPGLALANGFTPLSGAADREHQDIVEELIQSGRLNLNQEINIASEFGQRQLATKLRKIRNAKSCKKLMKAEKDTLILAQNLGDIEEAKVKQMVEKCYDDVLAKRKLLKSREDKAKEVARLEDQLDKLKSKEQKDLEKELKKVKALPLSKETYQKTQKLQNDFEKLKSEDQKKAEEKLKKTGIQLESLRADTTCASCMDCLFEKGNFIALQCQHLHCKECYLAILEPRKQLAIEDHGSDVEYGEDLNASCPLCRGKVCDTTVLEVMALKPDLPNLDEKCVPEEIVPD